MANGGPTPFIYTGSGSPNGSSGSTDNSPLSNPLPTHFYATQYAAQEAFYPQPVYVSYSYASGEYEPHDSQTTDVSKNNFNFLSLYFPLQTKKTLFFKNFKK